MGGTAELGQRQERSELASLAALCLFLSAVEYAIPKPLPFLRLGLANLPILLSVKKIPVPHILLLAVLKVLAQALISGTLLSYVAVFSVAGTAASVLCMLALYFVLGRHVSFVGISLAGSLANNAAQLLCSRFIMFGENTRYIAPLLLVSGFVTALALGFFALAVEKKSRWYNGALGRFCTGNATGGKIVEKSKRNRFSTAVFVVCIFAMAAFLFVRNLAVQWSLVGVFLIFAEVKRRGKVNLLSPLLVVAFVTLFALITPEGKVIFSLGSWDITLGALKNGLYRGGTLVGMVFISQVAVNEHVRLPGAAGRLFSQVLGDFEFLAAEKMHFSKGHVIESLDEKLLVLWTGEMGTDKVSDLGTELESFWGQNGTK